MREPEIAPCARLGLGQAGYLARRQGSPE